MKYQLIIDTTPERMDELKKLIQRKGIYLEKISFLD